MARLTFYGAARQVTGSCYLLETLDKFRILIDCGIHQGSDLVDQEDAGTFGFDPASINALILTHAHLDHSGMIPMLVHQGFKRIYILYCRDL